MIYFSFITDNIRDSHHTSMKPHQIRGLFIHLISTPFSPTIPNSYWTSSCLADLSQYITSCDFYSSDRRFAYTFLQIPPHDGHPWCSAMSFPLLGLTRDFHPLECAHAGRTRKSPANPVFARL